MFQPEKAVEVIYDENIFNEFIGGNKFGISGKESSKRKDLCKGSVDES